MDGILHSTDSDGNLNVFNVEHDDDGLWLNTNWFNPQNVFNPDNRWVFVRNSLHSTTLLSGLLFYPATQHFAYLIELLR